MASADDVIPQVEGVAISYVGILETHQWLSLVDASLNNNAPCVVGSIAAHVADTAHSGPLQAASGTKEITIPQVPLMDASATFTVCYAEGNGTTSDTTWRDSYI